MYVWSSHITRVRINWIRLPILLGVSRTGKIDISLYSFALENLVSRDGFCSPVPCQPAHSPYIQAKFGACLLTGFLPISAAAWRQPATQTNRDTNRDKVLDRSNHARISKPYWRQDDVFEYELQLFLVSLVLPVFQDDINYNKLSYRENCRRMQGRVFITPQEAM